MAANACAYTTRAVTASAVAGQVFNQIPPTGADWLPSLWLNNYTSSTSVESFSPNSLSQAILDMVGGPVLACQRSTSLRTVEALYNQ